MRNRVLALALAGLPTVAHAQAPARRVVASQVDSIARAALQPGRVPGLSIAVVRGSDTLVMAGWGMADLENRVPAGPQTVYRIGSITKQFTAALILIAERDGHLGLDDSLQQYVPGFPTPGGRVSIRHLLTHTSGIPSYTSLGPAWRAAMRLDLSEDSLLGLIRSRPPDYSPGQRFLYDNSGYYLLGMILERTLGRPYPDLVLERLVNPLGLRATGYCYTWPIIPNRAQGYEPGPGALGVENADYISMALPFSAGGLCSTVGDLVAWTRALAQGRVVPDAYSRMSASGRLGDGTPTHYGFGLFADTLEGHRRIWHSGGINGFSSSLAAFPDDSLIVAVLTNSEAGNAARIGTAVARVSLGLPLPAAPQQPAGGARPD
jgi:CubicO group peptidase (beta-lactamase class C family)